VILLVSRLSYCQKVQASLAFYAKQAQVNGFSLTNSAIFSYNTAPCPFTRYCAGPARQICSTLLGTFLTLCDDDENGKL
jgi:hypothetical protein